MSWKRNLHTLLTTKGMMPSYLMWLAHRSRGTVGPLIRLSSDTVVGAEWLSFSEFWSYRSAEYGHERTNSVNPRVRGFLQRCARPNGIAVDVGANIGVFTAELAALGFEVHSFEPIPETCARLRLNLGLNGDLLHRIHVNERAVSDVDGKATMTGPGMSPGTAYLSTRAGNGDHRLIEVRMTTLDSYAAQRQLEKIDFLKVDVEGYEPAVFRGAGGLLARQAIRTIYFEWSPSMMMRAGFDPPVMLGQLTEAGYKFFDLDESGALQEIDERQLLQEQRAWDNLVATACGDGWA